MTSIAIIVAGLAALASNAGAFVALGADVENLFEKGRALVSSNTASTPEERAVALLEIDELEKQRDARLEELGRIAPNS